MPRLNYWQNSKIKKNARHGRKIFGISAKHLTYPQNIWHIRKIFGISANIWHIRKIFDISAKYLAYPQNIKHIRKIFGISANIWHIRKYLAYPQNIFKPNLAVNLKMAKRCEILEHIYNNVNFQILSNFFFS